MSRTEVTVRGNVADDPRIFETANGQVVANFRLVSTERRLVRDTGEWVDRSTLWLSVSCWRSLGENVAKSIKKGQPVIVHGRMYGREFESNGQNRVDYTVDADAVGHDLSRGQAVFTKMSDAILASTSVEVDADGAPPMAEEPDWSSPHNLGFPPAAPAGDREPAFAG
jgi:single-strand DNA-binding protein